MVAPSVQVVEIKVKGTAPTTGSGTKNLVNVFHYRLLSGPGTQQPTVDVGNRFIATVWSVIATALSVTYTGVETDARLIDDANNQDLLCNVPGNGAVAGTRLPMEDIVSILLRSSLRGRNFRGAKRFGPVANADFVNDELTAGAIAGHWGAVGPAIAGTMLVNGLGTYGPVILSKSLSQLEINPTTIICADITGALLNKTIGSMRRRKEKTVR